MQQFITSDFDKKWLKRVQEQLAIRSVEGGSFNKVYNLLRTKRLARMALTNVLRNRGAYTPGVDGKSRRNYDTLRSRYALIDEINSEIKRKEYSPLPVRRVLIPKANGKMRPLGIPTFKDRVVQEMLRLILEPIYEGKFYNHSYGFRPYRSTHHAIKRLWYLHAGRGNFGWVVEGDIKACFDEIDHNKLIKILRKTIKDGRVIHVIRKMLSAGHVEQGSDRVIRSKKGTPQGGIISPLLANIFLNELDGYIAEMYDNVPFWRRRPPAKQKSRKPLPGRFLVRYADDFVVACNTKEDAEVVKSLVTNFLDQLGLVLSDEKTRITSIDDGYDFLGFNLKRFNGKVLVKPSHAAKKRFRKTFKQRLKLAIGNHKGINAGLVKFLDQLVRGWGYYYATVNSKRDFANLDHYIWWTLFRTSKRLAGNGANGRKVYLQRFLPMKLSTQRADWKYNRRQFGVWEIPNKSAFVLTLMASIPIKYITSHPQLNPYLPGNDELLDKRLKKVPSSTHGDVPEAIMKGVPGGYGIGWTAIRRQVLKRDGYRCTKCGRKTDLHVHHQEHRVGSLNAETLDNLLTLCRQCHRGVHSRTP